jgi:hypothetical protein
MGEIVEFPIAELEFRRAVRALEGFMRDYLADGPQMIHKVRKAAAHISREEAHLKEARRNLGVRRVEDTVRNSWYWTLPGDEAKVPNAIQYSYLPPRKEPWLARQRG